MQLVVALAALVLGPCGALSSNSHRQLQHKSVCTKKNWNVRTTEYMAACCPAPQTMTCPGGIPKQCDEKCTVVFNPFYRDCYNDFPSTAKKNMDKVKGMCKATGFITVSLGAKNGQRAHSYEFKVVTLAKPNYSTYSKQMINACKKIGMKPVCDHPAYCKGDDQALYLGQTNHIAYKPHRTNKSYNPVGWEKIQKLWDGKCSYTGRAGGSKDMNAKYGALCNIPANSHSWKNPQQANPGFVCGRENSKVANTDLFYSQITWAGGAGCKGDHNKDAQSKTGVMCATMEGKGMVSRPCRTSATNQQFRMEHISGALFGGKTNKANEAGSYRLRNRRHDWQCLQYVGSGCGKYQWGRCKLTAGAQDNQVFHLSNFVDDLDDADVFNWAGYEGRAMSAANCHGYVNGNPIQHCKDDMNQGKRWQLMATSIPLRVFRATLGNSLGTADHEYEFQVTSLSRNRKGTYSSLMIAACRRYDMKPICGHPSYCKTDTAAIYLGQKNHLSYPPHRRSDTARIPGMKALMPRFEGRCVYTGAANKDKALCNIPINTHSWRTPAQANPGFLCAKIIDGMFTIHLGGKNGVRAHAYELKIANLDKLHGGSYSKLMVGVCKRYGMKPVCDNPSYCATDDKALYLGQNAHIAYKPHRTSSKLNPAGWEAIQSKWDGLCSYTGTANQPKNGAQRNSALCNIPSTSHSWKKPSEVNPGFMCGRENTKVADSQLFYTQITWAGGAGCKGDQNKDTVSEPGMTCASVEGRGMVSRKCRKTSTNQLFRMEHVSGALFMGKKNKANEAGSYRLHNSRHDWQCLTYLGNGCGKYQWSRCKLTAGAQDNQVFHLSNFMDDLDDADVFNWAGYDGRAMSAASCRGYVNGNPIQHCKDDMNQGKRWQMQITSLPLRVFRATLGNSLGTADHEYEFQVTSLSRNRKGTYSSLMIAACRRYDMKPICGHPSYCKTDTAAIYLGQKNHLSYPPHRRSDTARIPGMKALMPRFEGRCVYTGAANKDKALCNIPINTHSWRTPAQANPGFLCAKIIDGMFTIHLGGKNGVRAHAYELKIANLDKLHGGSYSKLMVGVCKRYGMKPVCDNPSYCATDDKALYLGQNAHIAYKPHRTSSKLNPAGWEAIQSKWDGLCSYTGTANQPKNGAQRNSALCNIPSTSHSWKKPSEVNPGFMCGRENTKVADSQLFYTQITWAGGAGCKGDQNKDTVSEPGMMCAAVEGSGMVSRKCSKTSAKQLFRMEHITGALFRGRTNKANEAGSYRLHYKNNDNLCLTYSTHGRCGTYKYTRCKTAPGNTIADGDNQVFHLSNFMDDLDDADVFNWAGFNGKAMEAANCRGYSNGNPIRHCADNMNQGKRWQMLVTSIPLKLFKVVLGNSLGTADHEYEFRIVGLGSKHSTTDTYSNQMVSVCSKYDMKPICGHPSYCKKDVAAIYLGQKGHLSYPPNRNSDSNRIPGVEKLMPKLLGRCVYTGTANKDKALCNIPTNSHSWRSPAQANPGFLCAKIIDGFYEVHLGARNGVPAATYEFKIANLDRLHGGSYAKLMVEQCSRYDMKPVCDHPTYCKNDKNALYLGQQSHIAYKPNRDATKLHAAGWAVIKDKWSGLCSYTGNAGKSTDRNLWNKALCNIPINTHTWKMPSEVNPGFMCGRLAEDSSNLKKGSSLDKLLARVRACRKAGTQVSLDGGGSGHRRRMQTGYTGSSCSRKILPHRIADYNAACCPHGATSCPNGMPKSCSAECAAVYDPFYAACKKNFPKSSKKNMQTLLGMCAKVPTAPIAAALKASHCK